MLTIIAENFALSLNIPPTLDIASAPAALALGIGAGWWMRRGWYGSLEQCLLNRAASFHQNRTLEGPRSVLESVHSLPANICSRLTYSHMGIL